MSARDQTVVIIRVEDEAPSSTRDRIASILGIGGGSSGLKWRWHCQGLVSAWPDSISDRVVGELEAVPGVLRVLTLADAARLFRGGSNGHADVSLGTATFGLGRVTVIAGPCSIETEDQVLRVAEEVAEAGAKVLRGGVFKPRTQPYSFGGLGEHGLELMAKARERTGLPFVTEALDPSTLDVVAAYADGFQIGSRNMHNSSLLFDVGAHPSGLPILFKRGFSATIDEFLSAAEYILLGRVYAGHEDAAVLLCERGIRTYERSTRYTLDVGAIPVLQESCSLPVIVDPSHAAGARPYVAPLARAAVAAGASGLLVEVHPDPDSAWCDGAQSLTPAEFREMMHDIGRFAN